MKPGGALTLLSLRCCSSPSPKKLLTIHFVLAPPGKWTTVKQRVLGKVLYDHRLLRWNRCKALVKVCSSSSPVHWLGNSQMDQLVAQHLPWALQPPGTMALGCQKVRSLQMGTGRPHCLPMSAVSSYGRRPSSARHLHGTDFMPQHSNLGRISTPHETTLTQRGNIIAL